MILSYLVWELDVNNKMCIVIKSDLPHNCLVVFVNVSANNTNWRETQNPNDWHFKTNRLSRWDIQFACNLPTGYPTQRNRLMAYGDGASRWRWTAAGESISFDGSWSPNPLWPVIDAGKLQELIRGRLDTWVINDRKGAIVAVGFLFDPPKCDLTSALKDP